MSDGGNGVSAMVSEILEEARTGRNTAHERELAAHKAEAQKETVAYAEDLARRTARAAADEQDQRARDYLSMHLGTLNPDQYRKTVRELYGFDPQV